MKRVNFVVGPVLQSEERYFSCNKAKQGVQPKPTPGVIKLVPCDYVNTCNDVCVIR